MSVGWDSLPLVPLRRILDYLSIKDALAAMSVCKHWRSATLLYEGHKLILDLRAKQHDRSLFMARLFRKKVRRLVIYLDETDDGIEKFFYTVLPEFFDSQYLEEMVLIGPNYVKPNYDMQPKKIKRVIMESLVFKNLHYLQKFAMLGCEMDEANEDDRFVHEHIEYYSAPLKFSSGPASSVFSSSNTGLMQFSVLRHLSLQYCQLSTECLATLSHLAVLSSLSIAVTSACEPRRLDWTSVADSFQQRLEVSVCLVCLPPRALPGVMDDVLGEGMTLVSLKVLYCKTLYAPLITHVVRYHKTSLRALVWVDAPHQPAAVCSRVLRHDQPREQMDTCNINPFILLCWQCTNLRALTIHGYWIWQYDILGFVRLRNTLRKLEISAIYHKHNRLTGSTVLLPDTAIRVLVGDTPMKVDPAFIAEVNSYASFEEDWQPAAWRAAPPAPPAPLARALVLRELLATFEEDEADGSEASDE